MKSSFFVALGLGVAWSFSLVGCNGSTKDTTSGKPDKTPASAVKTSTAPGTSGGETGNAKGNASKGGPLEGQPTASSFDTETEPSGGAPTLTGKETRTTSGLQYLDVVAGDGATPNRGQKAVIHTVGWLESGAEIENTRTKGKPFEFTVGAGAVIRGFEEAVATMKVGGKRRIFLTAALGFGQRGSKLQGVPPNSPTTWEIELIELR